VDPIKQKMMWNGVIRSISLAYLNLGISASIKLKDMMTNPETVDTVSIAIMAGLFIVLVGYIFFPLGFMIRYRELLDS